MKKNQFRFIKVLVCLSFTFFCCENISFAQTSRRKPAAKRSKTPVVVNAQNSQNDAAVITDPKLQPDAEVAVFETDYGAIAVELYPKLAPLMVERFKKLIREGFYNKTTFHRMSLSPGIIQGGDLTFA